MHENALQDLEDEDVDEDDDAADAGAPKRPGADKRKLAEAFERERSKQKRAKEAADSKVRALHSGANHCCGHCTLSVPGWMVACAASN